MDMILLNTDVLCTTEGAVSIYSFNLSHFREDWQTTFTVIFGDIG